ncbi:diguanylate cyclase (GGDEF) domain-containing protein [Ruminococcaceae bacterium YRB3002]|nr:diguanylate cyclase (GGDEF) domain-containing protein [Ruminococcaceae bacterium YRB3002]
MKIFEYAYKDSKSFKKDLNELKKWCNANNASNVLFHVYTLRTDEPELGSVLQMISSTIPRALYVGASSNGNILNGELSEAAITVVATVTEAADTTIQIHQYQFTDDTEERFTRQIVDMVNNNPNIKAVEFLLTIEGMSVTTLCDNLSKLRDDVAVFGGAALNPFMDMEDVVVFSKVGDVTGKSIVVILYGGSELSADAFYIGGWNPLGHKMKVTRSDKNVLYELDGKPAYDAYCNYLDIKNDENFLTNSLGFPLILDMNGVGILRAPVSCNPDGSLNMTADVKEGVQANLAYGDPWTILRKINEYGIKVQEFAPQSIQIFSCATRKIFWNGDSVETRPFASIAPTTGFYTAGEFVRTDRTIDQHNVTMVVVTMREGDAVQDPSREFVMADSNKLKGEMSMVNRLANFLDKATMELEEANALLSIMAITDGLSTLFNRGEIQRRISIEVMRAVSSRDDNKLPSLIMIDIDNFKAVNDYCGHNEGDNVIKGLAAMMKSIVSKRAPGAFVRKPDANEKYYRGLPDGVPCCGRWGGEEFMVLLPSTSLNAAAEIAEVMRSEFEKTSFPQAGCQTISIGVARAVRGENVDTFCGRVDAALYKAKKEGKNRVIVG